MKIKRKTQSSINDKKDKILPSLNKGDEVNIHFVPTEKVTAPPPHYTLETFNNFLKNPFRKEGEGEEEEYKAILSGIELGTEATRTGIIEKAIKDNNISLRNGSYYITDSGKAYVKALEALQVDMSKEKTVELSQLLKKVYKGEVTIQDCLSFTVKEIREVISHKDEIEISGSTGVGKCPVCGGRIKAISWGYGCSNYKNGCGFSISKKIAEKTLSEAQVRELLEKGVTEEIKGFKSKDGKEFSAKLKIEEGKVAFVFFEPQKTSFHCPCCSDSLTKEKWEWKCRCGFSLNHEIAGKKLSDTHLDQLIHFGITNTINGFKSKAGKIFSAKLKLNKEKKVVEFIFD